MARWVFQYLYDAETTVRSSWTIFIQRISNG